MTAFKYKVKDRSGKTILGQRLAESRKSLVTELGKANFFIISVEEETKGKAEPAKTGFLQISIGKQKVKTSDLVIFCKQLGTMLRGGVPILRAIESIAFELKNKTFKTILYEIVGLLRAGKSFSESLKKYPHVFPVIFSAMVEAGEKVGALHEMLFRVGKYLEAKNRLIRKMQSIAAYPLFMSSFFVVIVGIIIFFLIPKFQQVYADFGTELPGLTQFMINTSTFIINNVYAVLFVGIVTTFSLVIFIKHTEKGKRFFDRLMISLPLFGKVIKKSAVSKLCRTLSTLLEEGIPVTEALGLVGKTSGNVVIDNASQKVCKLIGEGETIPSAFIRAKIFPPIMLQMISVGVESGALPKLLGETADFYEDQVDGFINTLTALAEPVLVVCLGIFISVVVVGLYLPIFGLGSAITGGA